MVSRRTWRGPFIPTPTLNPNSETQVFSRMPIHIWMLALDPRQCKYYPPQQIMKQYNSSWKSIDTTKTSRDDTNGKQKQHEGTHPKPKLKYRFPESFPLGPEAFLAFRSYQNGTSQGISSRTIAFRALRKYFLKGLGENISGLAFRV